jgi:hypothetical protein
MDQNSIEDNAAARVSVRRLTAFEDGADSDEAAAGSTAGAPEQDSSNRSSPEGLSGLIRRRDGARLVVELDPIQPDGVELLETRPAPLPAAGAVSPGDLVEVRSARLLYLGQVRAVRGLSLTVILEHSVEIESLEAIRHIWNRPGTAGD